MTKATINLGALLDALKARDAGAVTALLDAEPALAHARPNDGPSPLLMAAYLGAADVAALLCARGAEPDAPEAAALGDVSRLEALLRADPALHAARSPDGWTPLHLACFFGHPAAARLLLDYGADLQARSEDASAHNTPLHAAIAGARDHTLIDLLLEHGADVNAVAGGGVTPLHLAASRGDLALIDTLLAHGARATRTDEGQTPEALAAARGFPEAAAYLQRVAYR